MSKILFAVSGSIACAKAALAVSQLIQRGHEVQIAATPAALSFVGTATWEGLTNRPVAVDLFAEGQQMDHIHLARWADVYVLAPATAHALGQWAHGLANDFPSTLFLAFEKSKPIMVAPAMNQEMWSHPAVQANLKRLQDWNVQVISPDEGHLACGEIGAGRLASVENLIARIENAQAVPTSLGNVLITSGATREWIDGIRFLSNVSTGQTGADLADHLQMAGWSVTYLHGVGAQRPMNNSIGRLEFSDFASLEIGIKSCLAQKNYNFVLQAAAVSDFSVREIADSFGNAVERTGDKLSSDQELVLRLKQNPKLVTHIKEWGGPHLPRVIAFKLTHSAKVSDQESAVLRLLDHSSIDAVVWNDWSGISAAGHIGKYCTRNSAPISFSTKRELVETVAAQMRERSSWS